MDALFDLHFCLGTHIILVFDFAFEGMGLGGLLNVFFFGFLHLYPKVLRPLGFLVL